MGIVAALSILGLAGWWWLLSRHPAGLAPVGAWTLGDAVLGGAISAWFVASAFAANTAEETPVTPEIIRLSLALYAMILVLVCGSVVLRGASLAGAFGLRPARPWLVVGTGILGLALAYPPVDLAGRIMGLLGHPVSSDDGLVQYFRNRPAAGDLVLAIAMAVVVAPLAEELLFRGYLYGILKKYGGRAVATLASAALFSASHPNLPGVPSLFLLAVCLVLAYELTGSLWAPIVMHALFNSATVVVILWFPQWIR